VASAPLGPELEAIFAEELNVKSIRYTDPAGSHAAVVLDTTITDELRLEWLAREVSRKVNELRKQAANGVLPVSLVVHRERVISPIEPAGGHKTGAAEVLTRRR